MQEVENNLVESHYEVPARLYPSHTYFQDYNVERTTNTSSTILILLDIHGTIVCETFEKLQNAQFQHINRRKQYVYMRPDLEDLIMSLSTTGYTVGIYSSAVIHNIKSTLEAIFPEYEKYVDYIFDRQFNKKDYLSDREWDTVRDLDYIWRKVPAFNYKNTIVIDNEVRKIRDYPRNAIIVEEFSPERVHHEATQSYLPQLSSYLSSIFEKFQSYQDVSSLLELTPFNTISSDLYSGKLLEFAPPGRNINDLNVSYDAYPYYRDNNNNIPNLNTNNSNITTNNNTTTNEEYIEDYMTAQYNVDQHRAEISYHSMIRKGEIRPPTSRSSSSSRNYDRYYENEDPHYHRSSRSHYRDYTERDYNEREYSNHSSGNSYSDRGNDYYPSNRSGRHHHRRYEYEEDYKYTPKYRHQREKYYPSSRSSYHDYHHYDDEYEDHYDRPKHSGSSKRKGDTYTSRRYKDSHY